MERQHVDFTPRLPANVVVENPSRDYTPPSALSLWKQLACFLLSCSFVSPTLAGSLTPGSLVATS